MKSRILFTYPLAVWLLAAWLIASPIGGQAEVYKWVDENGRTHYSDTRPEQANVEPVDIDVVSYSFPTVDVNQLYERNRAREEKRAAASRKVILYSTTWCGYCTRARNFFRKNNIPFTEYDVEKSARGKRDYQKLNGRGVPIILVGKRRLNGFNKSSFLALYNAPN